MSARARTKRGRRRTRATPGLDSAAAAARSEADGSGDSPATELGDPVLRWTAAACLTGAALVHAVAASPHHAVWPEAGWFFVLLELAQLLLALQLLLAASRAAAGAAIAVNLAALVVWGVSRSVGMPFGPARGAVDAVGRLDLVTAVLELTAIAVLVPLLGARVRARRARTAALYAQAALLVAGTAALTGYALSAAGDHSGQRGASPPAAAATIPTLPELPELPELPGLPAAGPPSEAIGVPLGTVPAGRAAVVVISALTSEFGARGFDRTALTLPAGAAVVLRLTNRDSAPHNISLHEPDGPDLAVFTGKTIQAGEAIDYAFAVPPAGVYRYVCDLHPWMEGTLTAS